MQILSKNVWQSQVCSCLLFHRKEMFKCKKKICIGGDLLIALQMHFKIPAPASSSMLLSLHVIRNAWKYYFHFLKACFIDVFMAFCAGVEWRGYICLLYHASTHMHFPFNFTFFFCMLHWLVLELCLIFFFVLLFFSFFLLFFYVTDRVMRPMCERR